MRITRGDRSACLLLATIVTKRWDEHAEVSRGHIRFVDRTEGPNLLYGIRTCYFDEAVETEWWSEISTAILVCSRRNWRSDDIVVSNLAAIRDFLSEGV